MLLERLKLFREVAIDCQTSGGTIAVDVKTDSPAPLSLRRSVTISSNGRQTVAMVLPWNTKGFHIQIRIAPAFGATVEVFGVKVHGKPVGLASPTGWAWFPVYVRETPDGWLGSGLAIRPTPEDWYGSPLPIDGTPQDWRASAIAMPNWSPFPQWIPFPMDQIG